MKGERTKQQVLERAAALFNEGGYRATSISEVMAATGLKKGGIYRHFENKNDLSLQAFDFAVAKMEERFRQKMGVASGARDKLLALIGVYASLPIDPPVPGGCPLLNAAVEADDAYPPLRERAQEVTKGLLKVVADLIQQGKRSGEFGPQVAPASASAVLVASLEGAVMLAKIQGTLAPMNHAVRHLRGWIDEWGA